MAIFSSCTIASAARSTPCKCVCRADQRLPPKHLSGLALRGHAASSDFRTPHSIKLPRLTDVRRSLQAKDDRDRRQDQRPTMTVINIRNLGVTLSAPLFSQLNLVVNAGDRIGLVAANGRGKSTLLRCIAGTIEATEGEITRSRGLTVGYVEQHVPPALMDLPFRAAVLQTLPAERQASESWRVDVALDQLEVPEALREKPLKQLSGGWQRLAMLARVVVRGSRRAAARRADQPSRPRTGSASSKTG